LEDYIREFSPNVLYIEEEPYTSFAVYCTKIAEKLNIPTAVFTWENIIGKSFGERNDEMESEVIAKASIIIAGNEGAKQRLIHLGAAEDKIAICPQTGIDTTIFKPMLDVEKTHDVAYIGRMVKEKGIEYIENVVKELDVKMLWVGGRGDRIPSYGVYIGWVDYLNLPEYYNKAKLFVTYPYSFNGYSEQFNYSIGEALACGTPVLSSKNGSIYEVYKGSSVLFGKEANEEVLKNGLQYLLSADIEKRVEDGIRWVKKTLSVSVIARRLVEILKGA